MQKESTIPAADDDADDKALREFLEIGIGEQDGDADLAPVHSGDVWEPCTHGDIAHDDQKEMGDEGIDNADRPDVNELEKEASAS